METPSLSPRQLVLPPNDNPHQQPSPPPVPYALFFYGFVSTLSAEHCVRFQCQSLFGITESDLCVASGGPAVGGGGRQSDRTPPPHTLIAVPGYGFSVSALFCLPLSESLLCPFLSSLFFKCRNFLISTTDRCLKIPPSRFPPFPCPRRILGFALCDERLPLLSS
jgi:hypothetical protein